MAEVDPKLCIALDDINEAMDCENQDNMGGIIPSVIFGYHADVATWPDYPKKKESPLSLEEAGTLVGDLVMKENCRAYKMDSPTSWPNSRLPTREKAVGNRS